MDIFEQIQKGQLEEILHRAEMLGDDETINKAFCAIIEKGGKANIGEIREWKGGKFRKTPQGWKPVSEKIKEKFVDEDTGEEFEVERTIDSNEHGRSKTISPSQEKRYKKADKISAKYLSSWQEASEKVSKLNKELINLHSEKRNILQEQETIAGKSGYKLSDEHANKFGDKLNEIDKKINTQKKLIIEARKVESEAYKRHNEYDNSEYTKRLQPK